MWIAIYMPLSVLSLIKKKKKATIKITVCVPWHLQLCLISDNSDGSLERCGSKVVPRNCSAFCELPHESP